LCTPAAKTVSTLGAKAPSAPVEPKVQTKPLPVKPALQTQALGAPVQVALALQPVAPGWQTPAEQTSPLVQPLLSLQGKLLFTCPHPLTGWHESSVHGLPSSQLTPAPGTHVPPEQVSPCVHTVPSEQELLLFGFWQPVRASQVSVVQSLPSAQVLATPGAQTPPAQTSPSVQTLPSVQERALLTCAQPLAAMHESVVQSLPSLQLGGAPPTQEPTAHASLSVQAEPSSQGNVLSPCPQPVAGLQKSVVHNKPSPQSLVAPGAQLLLAQTSPTVHALPSSHVAVLATFWQPVAALHESSVHGLPSLQFRAGPATHVPPEHASPAVHSVPSLHSAVL